jgi:hypothetical protein
MSDQSLIPVVSLPFIYHLGELTLTDEGGVVGLDYTVPRQWLYEHGLFSVSLDPEHWTKHGEGSVYAITRRDGHDLQLLDLDLLFPERLDAVLKAATAHGLLGNGQLRCPAYKALGIVDCATPPDAISLEQASMEACAAILATEDRSLDGVWWSSGGIEIPRGGLFQHLLAKVICKEVQMPNSASVAPPAVWTGSPVCWGRP